MKIKLLLASIAVLASCFLVLWKEALNPKPIVLIPVLSGKGEYCLTCHGDLPQISASHPIETFGCVICHGGQPLALEANLAHSTMRGGDNPSRLEVVEQSCGGEKCHSGSSSLSRDHIHRVLTSIQATYSGAITQVLYSFGMQGDNTARYAVRLTRDEDGTSLSNIVQLEEFSQGKFASPLVRAFAQNCLSCHIGAEPMPGEMYQRLSGCAACHTPLTNSTTQQDNTPVHTLTLAIPYSQCNTCHNRGNYDLRTMSFVPRTDQPADRFHDYYQPIAQFVRCEWTLDCVDCHTRQEIMGDGDIHSYQKDIQYIQCRTCHGTVLEPPLTKTITDPEDLALKMAFLNPVINLKVGDTILVTEKGEPLWNIRLLPDGRYELFAKASGQRFTFKKVMGSACQQNPLEQESRYCHQCHAEERSP